MLLPSSALTRWTGEFVFSSCPTPLHFRASGGLEFAGEFLLSLGNGSLALPGRADGPGLAVGGGGRGRDEPFDGFHTCESAARTHHTFQTNPSASTGLHFPKTCGLRPHKPKLILQ